MKPNWGSLLGFRVRHLQIRGGGGGGGAEGGGALEGHKVESPTRRFQVLRAAGDTNSCQRERERVSGFGFRTPVL